LKKKKLLSNFGQTTVQTEIIVNSKIKTVSIFSINYIYIPTYITYMLQFNLSNIIYIYKTYTSCSNVYFLFYEKKINNAFIYNIYLVFKYSYEDKKKHM